MITGRIFNNITDYQKEMLINNYNANEALGIIMALAFIFITMLFFFGMEKFQIRLDRYRIKYGFDREIEGKDMSDVDKELKLNKRERRFKRRTFKD